MDLKHFTRNHPAVKLGVGRQPGVGVQDKNAARLLVFLVVLPAQEQGLTA